MTTPSLYSSTGHYYQYVTNTVTASSLYNGYALGSYRGLQGYLATITSSGENSFIRDLVAVNPGTWAFFGASDAETEGTMKWIAGPEAGTAFYSGYAYSGGTSIGGAYSNWMRDHHDPTNGSGSQNEDYAVMRTSTTNINGNPTYYLAGAWADANSPSSYGYIVEYGGLAPVYTISRSASSVNEGESITFEVATTNIEWGSSINYSISGISSSDLSSGSLSGTATVNQDGTNGKATVTFTLANDRTTEGSETLTFTAGGATSTATIVDTSLADVQYALSAGASTYDEGQTAAFSLTATGGSVGSAVSYTVSGVTAADLTNGTLSGSVVLGAGGRATISLPIAADRLTEGNETLTVAVGSVSASTTIRDTSTALTSTTSGATKTYTVASTQASVRSSDGGATWTVVTPSGTETLATSDRLRFSDKTIALDFDRGEAGHKTVTMIGAAFGKSFINQYFGTGVSLFDSGQSMAQIAQLVVSTGLIESMVGSSNSAWVRHVYKNVVGVNPDAFTEAVYRTYLDNGTHTKASLLELAAGVTALESQIDLVGIRSEGIGYVPFI